MNIYPTIKILIRGHRPSIAPKNSTLGLQEDGSYVVLIHSSQHQDCIRSELSLDKILHRILSTTYKFVDSTPRGRLFGIEEEEDFSVSLFDTGVGEIAEIYTHSRALTRA